MNKFLYVFILLCSEVSFSKSSNITNVKEIVSEILDTQNEVLEDVSSTKGEFNLTHYSTGFSVSKAGRVGLSSLNAKKSISVYWKRKNISSDTFEQTMNLVSTNNRKIMSSQFSEIIELVLNLKLGVDVINLGVNLKDYFDNMNALFEQISTDTWNSWQFDGLRTDLYIGVDGTISQVFSAGVALRLRIEWKHKRTQQVKKSKSSLSRLVKNLLQDIDYALKRHRTGEFNLDKVYIGVGHSSALRLFGIANTAQSLMAYARFKRINEMSVASELTTEQEDYPLIKNTNNKGIGKLFRIKRSRWRRGLLRALKMTNPYVESSDKESENWEVFKVKSAFEVNYRGWLGFSSRTTNAVVEFDFLKNTVNYVEYPGQGLDRGQKWFMELIRLKIRLEAGFKIPFITSAKIYPEMEFYWVR